MNQLRDRLPQELKCLAGENMTLAVAAALVGCPEIAIVIYSPTFVLSDVEGTLRERFNVHFMYDNTEHYLKLQGQTYGDMRSLRLVRNAPTEDMEELGDKVVVISEY